MGLFFYKKIRNPFSRMHSPSRFPLNLSEQLSLQGAEGGYPPIPNRSSIQKAQ